MSTDGTEVAGASSPSVELDEACVGTNGANEDSNGRRAVTNPGAPTEDPRLSPEYVRRVDGDAPGVGDVLVLGAVHDHPASSYRVAAFVRAFDSDVLALELSPLALPWFEANAGASGDGPRSAVDTADAVGGRTSNCEMTAAIAAAPDARAVAVDGFDAAFARTLLRNLRAEGPSLATMRAVARGLFAVVRQATARRLAATVEAHTPLSPDVGEPVEHDCDRSDPPAVQAADEHKRASTSLALLRAADPPAPVAVRDETREACMVRRIERLRTEGDVAAVVGLGHLDPVADGLAGAPGEQPVDAPSGPLE